MKTYIITEESKFIVNKGTYYLLNRNHWDGNLVIKNLGKPILVEGDQIVEGSQIVGCEQKIEGDQVIKGHQTVKVYQQIEGDQVVKGHQIVKRKQLVKGYQTVEGYQVKEFERINNAYLYAEQPRQIFLIYIIAILLSLTILAIVLIPNLVNAAEYTDEEAVKCIMGEARGEGYESMVAHGEAIRNRGTLKGVYGCNAKFSEPDWVWAKARKAWHESAYTNITNGADHWGSIIVDKEWIQKMVDMGFENKAIVNNTAFFKGKG